jgi:hypothetical protein
MHRLKTLLMRDILNRVLGRTTGLVYVPHDEAGAMKDARPGARLGRDRGPPWIVVDLDTEKVIVTAWPGRLWRVCVLRRASEQPMAYARYVRADQVEVLEEVPCATLFGAHGDAVVKVLDTAATLTREQTERLNQARLPDAHAAYMRSWNRWRAKNGLPHPIADHHAPLIEGGKGSPVGRGMSAVHDTVARRAKALDGDAAFRAEDEDLYLVNPWDGASDAMLHAALSLGAPQFCIDGDDDTLLRPWRMVFAEP